jgi:hypothetical protein
MRSVILLFLVLATPCATLLAAQGESYRADWHIELKAGDDSALVTLKLADGRPVRDIRFRYDPERFSDFEAEGKLTVTKQSVHWEPARENASLSYRVKVTRERVNKNQDKSYDALVTDEWALFRGDRVIPRMSVTARIGAVADTMLHLHVPENWRVNTGWPLDKASGDKFRYRVDDPDRRFDRPSGWIMAGRVGSRRDHVGSTYFSVVAPMDSAADRMGWLTLISLVYPEMEKAFGKVPRKILMVSGDDPLWRGGLSGPNSFYFHSSRRGVSENGTSPLLHEVVHVITRISGAQNDDWIAEGLAEFYGVEFLHRAGGISSKKKADILENLADWGKDAPKLRNSGSNGPITARAVVLFDDLNTEIRELTNNKSDIDEVTRLLMKKRRVSLQDLQEAFKQVTGSDSGILDKVE